MVELYRVYLMYDGRYKYLQDPATVHWMFGKRLPYAIRVRYGYWRNKS